MMINCVTFLVFIYKAIKIIIKATLSIFEKKNEIAIIRE